jgi:hypothetical protein
METKKEKNQSLKMNLKINRFFYFFDMSFLKSILSYLIYVLIFRFVSLLIWHLLSYGEANIYFIFFESINIMVPHLLIICGTYLILILMYYFFGKIILLKSLYMMLNAIANFSYIIFAIYYDLEEDLIIRFLSIIWEFRASEVLIPFITFILLINFLKKIHTLKFKTLIDYPSLSHGLEINFLRKIYIKKTSSESRISKKRQLEEKFKKEFDALNNHR